MLNIKEDYHIHCNYNDHSDINLTVKNIIDRAEELKLQTIAFTEHVRRTSSWIEQYLEEVNSFSKNTKIKVLRGFEAKILENGELDCPNKYLSKEYFLIASFHTKYLIKDVWLNALLKAIQNPRVSVIGHLAPEDTFELTTKEIEYIAEEIVNYNKIVEINAKYKRPPINLLEIFYDKGVKFHLGSDAHSLKDVGNYDRISTIINFLDKRKTSLKRNLN